MIDIGFTGTQEGMDQNQLKIFGYFMAGLYHHHFSEVRFHHGCCIGSDYDAALLARNLGFFIIGHPPINTIKMQDPVIADELRPPREYLDRNMNIVTECSLLIATPKTNAEELRSGTWTTIRYARKQDKPIQYILPR